LTTLQNVHLKIQELCKVYDYIPVNKIIQEIGVPADLTLSYIEALARLKYIDFADSKKKEITLTEIGKLTNI
jgi:hypothetical protein